MGVTTKSTYVVKISYNNTDGFRCMDLFIIHANDDLAAERSAMIILNKQFEKEFKTTLHFDDIRYINVEKANRNKRIYTRTGRTV